MPRPLSLLLRVNPGGIQETIRCQGSKLGLLCAKQVLISSAPDFLFDFCFGTLSSDNSGTTPNMVFGYHSWPTLRGHVVLGIKSRTLVLKMVAPVYLSVFFLLLTIAWESEAPKNVQE